MASKAISPPIAESRPHSVPFGAVKGENRGKHPFTPIRYREDPYFWLRDDDRKNEKGRKQILLRSRACRRVVETLTGFTVLDHLKLENAYAEQQTKHLEGLREELYKEHLSHLKETDDKVRC